MAKTTTPLSSRERLIKRYEQIIEEEVFSDEARGISMPVLCGVVRALKEGMGPQDFEYDRDCNMQHMDPTYFRKIRWMWDRAIRAMQRDLASKGAQKHEPEM